MDENRSYEEESAEYTDKRFVPVAYNYSVLHGSLTHIKERMSFCFDVKSMNVGDIIPRENMNSSFGGWKIRTRRQETCEWTIEV